MQNINANSGQWKKVSVPEAFLMNAEYGGLFEIEELDPSTLDVGLENSIESSAHPIPKVSKKRKKKQLDKHPSKKPENSSENNKEYSTSPSKCHINSDVVNSWSSFGFSDNLLSRLEGLDFKVPTEIQTCASSYISSEGSRNFLMIKSETGSGKTLAYSFPFIKSLEAGVSQEIEAVIIVPTRELCKQVRDQLICFLQPDSVITIHGGVSIGKQLRLLSRSSVNVVIATPGRLWEILQNDDEDLLQKRLCSIKYLVVDEADKLFENGRFEEFSKFMKFFSSRLDSCKKLFVSATADSLLNHQNFKEILTCYRTEVRDVQMVSSSNCKNVPSSKIQFCKIECEEKEKEIQLISYLIQCRNGKSIVFFNSIETSKKLFSMLRFLKMKVLLINSNMTQKERFLKIESFKSNDNSILLSTDLTARGIDIPNVDNVIHFHAPKDKDSYLHRSGRTARAGASGTVLFIICPKEYVKFNNFVNSFGVKFLKTFPDLKISEVISKVYPLLKELESIAYHEAKLNKEKQFERKFQDDFIVDDDKVVSDDNFVSARSSTKKKLIIAINSVMKKLGIL